MRGASATFAHISSHIAPKSRSPLTVSDPDLLTLTANNLTGNYPGLAAADPKFVAPNGDLRLGATSPCIDTADDAFATLVDVAGHARRDVPGVPVCTGPTPSCGTIADMGAYEFGY